MSRFHNKCISIEIYCTTDPDYTEWVEMNGSTDTPGRCSADITAHLADLRAACGVRFIVFVHVSFCYT
jgi:hypothetical protein